MAIQLVFPSHCVFVKSKILQYQLIKNWSVAEAQEQPQRMGSKISLVVYYLYKSSIIKIICCSISPASEQTLWKSFLSVTQNKFPFDIHWFSHISVGQPLIHTDMKVHVPSLFVKVYETEKADLTIFPITYKVKQIKKDVILIYTYYQCITTL